MSPVIRANLGLLVLNLTLASILWWRPGSSTQGFFPPLTELQASAIHDVRIYREGRLIAHAHKQGNRWQWMGNPGKHPDEQWLKHVLHIARLPSFQKFPFQPMQAARYGLHEPRYILQLNHVTIAFGGLTPIKQLRYVRIGGWIHVISDGYTHHLQVQP